MSSAGFQLVAGRIPGERIATATRTANSAGHTTTEAQTDTVTAALVSGRTYRVRYFTLVSSTIANDRDIVRVRQDNTSGGALTFGSVTLPVGSAAYPIMLEAQYTASSTGNKTFVATGARGTGTGTITHVGASNQPAYLYVDYISG